MKSPSPNARDRGLHGLRRITLGLGGGSVAALASAAYAAAATIPGSPAPAPQVAVVSGGPR